MNAMKYNSFCNVSEYQAIFLISIATVLFLRLYFFGIKVEIDLDPKCIVPQFTRMIFYFL